MADSGHHFTNLSKIISSRFKKATRDPDEFAQAAWTRVVFDQVNSLIWAVKHTPRVVAAATLVHGSSPGDLVPSHSGLQPASGPTGAPSEPAGANGDSLTATEVLGVAIEVDEEPQANPEVDIQDDIT